MKKRTVRLTESELKNIITESVKKILKEDYFDGKDYGFSQDNWGNTPDWKRRDYERMEQQMQDYGQDLTDIQTQHYMGKTPKISPQTQEFLKQDKITQNNAKQIKPLNKFQQRHKDNLERKRKEQWEQAEREWRDEQERPAREAAELLSTATDGEIMDFAMKFLDRLIDGYSYYRDYNDFADNIVSFDIIHKEIKSRYDHANLLYQAIIKVKDGNDITYSNAWGNSYAGSYPKIVRTLTEDDPKFDYDFNDEYPNSKQYVMISGINSDDFNDIRRAFGKFE